MQYFDDSLKEQTFAEAGNRLRSEVESAEPRLRAVSEEEASRARGDGKWSRKEVLGHLIDSAANNHQRFVRAQSAPAFQGPGYAQDHWVSVQGYAERPWSDLIGLWAGYNRHLAHVIARMPESARSVPCAIGDNPPVTLGYVALDYVGHVKHHLEQILG